MYVGGRHCPRGRGGCRRQRGLARRDPRQRDQHAGPGQPGRRVSCLRAQLGLARRPDSSALLEQRLKIPVYVDNPLKAVTLSEMWFGVGRVTDSMAVVNLGTGVGAGVAIDGALDPRCQQQRRRVGSYPAATRLLAVPLRPARLCRGVSRGARHRDLARGDRTRPTPRCDSPCNATSSKRSRRGSLLAIPSLTRTGKPVRRTTWPPRSVTCVYLLERTRPITLTGGPRRQPRQRLVPAVQAELPQHVLPGSLPGLTVESSRVPGNPVALGMAAFALEQFLGQLGLASPASAPGTRRRLRSPAKAEAGRFSNWVV